MIVFVHPVNRFFEAIIYHGYAKAGVVEVSIPLLFETDTAQPTVEPVDVETVAQPAGFDLTDPVKGMNIGGYPVTSLQGPRNAPCSGCSTFHNGVDSGTPSGTPLFAPGKIEVVCKYEGGGGYYAEFVHADMLWQTLHLTRDTCRPGGHELGWVFARTGATGRGSGPHLHTQLRSLQDRSFIKVKKGHIEVLLVQQGG